MTQNQTEQNQTKQVLEEVLQERTRQNEIWGGSEHDDSHSVYEFLGFIWQRIKGADEGIRANSYSLVRKKLLQIAALSVAAIESLDRKHAAKMAEKSGN